MVIQLAIPSAFVDRYPWKVADFLLQTGQLIKKGRLARIGFTRQGNLYSSFRTHQFTIEITAASATRSDKSYPETLTQTGSPNGALKLNRTAVPGKKPISSSFTDNSGSENPAIMAVSPGIISATLFPFPVTFI